MGHNLEVFSNGLLYENPFILASAPPSASFEQIDKAFNMGWAGAVTKTISTEEVESKNVMPRFSVIKNKNKIVAFENIEMLSEKRFDYWLNSIYKLKQKHPSKILVVSIMGAKGAKSWGQIALQVEDAGADAVELNFSCPNGVAKQGVGLAIGQNKDAISIITKEVKKSIKIPVIVKLTPNVAGIAEFALAATEAGADGLCAINTVLGLIGIDIETFLPKPNVNGYSSFGGISGNCIKPIGLRCIAEISLALNEKYTAYNNISVHAVGGVSDWKDTVEYISVGADVVQICTEVMINGFGIIDKLKSGLTEYLSRKNFSSLNEIRGIALNKITTHDKLDRSYKTSAKINYDKCKNCGTCINICNNSGGDAFYYDTKNTITIDEQKCTGCSLCNYTCPNQALYMSVN